MQASQWLEVMLLGIVSGAAGQLVRSIAGIVKLNQSRSDPSTPEETFQVNVLVISIIIGATAGLVAALAMFGNPGPDPDSKKSVQSVLGLMAAGYAGSDFILAFAGKYFGSSAQQAPAAVPPAEFKKQVLDILAAQKNTDGSLG